MIKTYTKLIFSFLFIAAMAVSFVFTVQFSRASAADDLQTQLDSAGTTGWGTPVNDPAADLPNLIKDVVSVFLSLLGIIFLVLIIYAGYNWMTAQGDDEKVTKAKNTLTRAIIGLIIILAAYAITYFVFQSLSGVNSTGTIVGGS
ncbi:MAG: hypothetical protein Q7R92_03750 [bacterium]|nr:hypothetical protein [bacterium]